MEEEIKIINDIIKEAIYHGGDLGGPYYVNDGELIESIDRWLKLKGLQNEYEVNDDIDEGMYQIVKK